MERITFTPTQDLLDLQMMFDTHRHQLRIVGGAVRDLVLGHEPKDIDLCTTATPDEMIEVGAAFPLGCRVVPTGLQHGTVTFVMKDGGAYEITTLRIDTDTDGRHADVQFTTSFEQDAARRDLTINAMSMDINGTVYDYFDGLKDLKANAIQFVGDPETRIREDYLRILRYFRFAARFRSTMFNDDLKIIEYWARGLRTISKERIWSEMSRLLMSEPATRRLIMETMEKYKVLDAIGMEYRYRHGHSLVERADCPVTAMACYITGNGEEFARSWHMSVPEIQKLAWLSDKKLDYPFQYDIEDILVAGKPRDWVVSWTKLHGDARCVFHAENWPIPEFPVKGQDLLDAGMTPGKAVGKELAYMKRVWIESRFTKTKEDLLCLAEATTPKQTA